MLSNSKAGDTCKDKEMRHVVPVFRVISRNF